MHARQDIRCPASGSCTRSTPSGMPTREGSAMRRSTLTALHHGHLNRAELKSNLKARLEKTLDVVA